jgi:hypothetical protein
VRSGFLLAGVAVLVLLAGCGKPGVVARPLTATPSASTPTESFDRYALAERVKKALIGPGGLVKVGVARLPEDEFDAKVPTSDYCHLLVIGESAYTHVAHQRTWHQSTMDVINTAHGYDKISGRSAVDSTRRNAQNCTSYEGNYSDGKIKHDLLGEIGLGNVPGTDASYARCELATFEQGPPRIACVAFLARGSLVSTVAVIYADLVEATQAKLLEIVPIAAAALSAA